MSVPHALKVLGRMDTLPDAKPFAIRLNDIQLPQERIKLHEMEFRGGLSSPLAVVYYTNLHNNHHALLDVDVQKQVILTHFDESELEKYVQGPVAECIMTYLADNSPQLSSIYLEQLLHAQPEPKPKST